MGFAEGKFEELPNSKEHLKKIAKRRIPRNSKKKCLACTEGQVMISGKIKACSACKGQGFIR